MVLLPKETNENRAVPTEGENNDEEKDNLARSPTPAQFQENKLN